MSCGSLCGHMTCHVEVSVVTWHIMRLIKVFINLCENICSDQTFLSILSFICTMRTDSSKWGCQLHPISTWYKLVTGPWKTHVNPVVTAAVCNLITQATSGGRLVVNASSQELRKPQVTDTISFSVKPLFRRLRDTTGKEKSWLWFRVYIICENICATLGLCW